MAALIWGLAFVAQKYCTEYISPFTYNAVRSYIGTAVLVPIILIMRSAARKKAFENGLAYEGIKNLKKLITGGICCGVLLSSASVLQQAGIEETSSGKAGFITALYVVLVPIFGIVMKKRTPVSVWISVIIAVIGLYLLCVKSGFTIARGDFIVFICAIIFALHILVIDYFSPMVDGIAMACLQFFVSALLSTVCMFIFEAPHISSILRCWLPLLYLGVFSTAVAYTLQIVMQKNTNPAVASLILSFESVFAALGGWIVLNEVLTARELTGCILMFAAVLLSQIPKSAFSALLCKRKRNNSH